jgi:hypothetical protein
MRQTEVTPNQRQDDRQKLLAGLRKLIEYCWNGWAEDMRQGFRDSNPTHPLVVAERALAVLEAQT